MPESSRGDRRPILPPPPPELAEQREAEGDARRQAEEREAEQARKAQEREAAKARKAEERRVQREKARSEKAEKEAAAQQRREQAAEKEERSESSAATAAAGGTAVGAMVARGGDQESADRTQTLPKVEGGRRGDEAAEAPRKPAPARRTRRAQLRLAQVDAWSVMKTSFLLSIAIGIVLVVAVGIVWAVLGAAGVWDSVNSIVQQAVGSADGPQFDVRDYVGTSRVLGIAAIVAVVDVLLITAIATLGAFIYNLSAALLGGIEVTLAEDN